MSIPSRRSFLTTAAGLITTAALPTPATARMEPAVWRTRISHGTTERRLFIKNRRTDEIFDDVYGGGQYLYRNALSKIDHLMRDRRSGEVIRMDRRLIELLSAVQRVVGYDEPIQMISGYRSRASNAKISRAAKNSYHIKGMAADFRIEGVSCKELGELGQRFSVGGVGYYPKRNFVHLDTGPVRTWRG